jgi:hypothetical protein
VAEVTVTSFNISPLREEAHTEGSNPHDLAIDITVEVTRTDIEFALQIPFDVHVTLRERDGSFDRYELEPHRMPQGLFQTVLPSLRTLGNDDRAPTEWGGPWYIGGVPGDALQVQSVSRTLHTYRDELPNELGKDEFYCIVVASPQIRPGTATTGIVSIK